MKTKKEIKEWLLKNAVDEKGNLDLSGIDFSCVKRTVKLNHIKAKYINNINQEAVRIFNAYHKANYIYNDNQSGGEIYNNNQKSEGWIYNYRQQGKDIENREQKTKEKQFVIKLTETQLSDIKGLLKNE